MSEPKKPILTPGQEVKWERAKSALSEFAGQEESFVRHLMEREEWRTEEIKKVLMGQDGFTDETWQACTRKAVDSIIVEVVTATPMRPYHTYKINQVYRPMLLEILNPSKDEETARITAGYVGPDQHCSTCTHCDEASRCRLYSFTCEPEGGCPDHEPRESSAGLSGLPEPEAQLE